VLLDPAIRDSWPVITINVYAETVRTGGRQILHMMDDDPDCKVVGRPIASWAASDPLCQY
jgi:hypothetical protein